MTNSTKEKNTNLRKILKELCSNKHIPSYYRSSNEKLKRDYFNFDTSDGLTVDNDYFTFETIYLLDKICTRENETLQLEKRIIKALKAKHKREGTISYRWDNRNLLRDHDDLTDLLRDEFNIDFDSYLGNFERIYTYNNDNDISNQVQFSQFNFNNKTYAFIQLSYKGVDVRCISDPYLVELKETEGLYNLCTKAVLMPINSNNENELYEYDLVDDFTLNKTKKTYTNNLTKIEYKPYYSV